MENEGHHPSESLQSRIQEQSWTLLTYNLLTNYIREQRDLSRTNNNDIQYQFNIDREVARFTQLHTFGVDPNSFLIEQEQLGLLPPSSINPPAPEPFLAKDILIFMNSLHRISTNTLPDDDDKKCGICFEQLGEWRWGENMLAEAGATEPFKVEEDMMPEDLVQLPCGHRYGELCLHSWLKETSRETPTCPKCRAVLRKVGEVNTPNTEEEVNASNTEEEANTLTTEEEVNALNTEEEANTLVNIPNTEEEVIT